MLGFLTALQFLTIIPLRLSRVPAKRDFATAIATFPLAGICIGLIVLLSRAVFSYVLSGTALSVVMVITLMVITGGLHLDGLADTADGIGARADRERTLEIMRDSRIGTMGVLALISVILLKVYLFAYLPTHRMFAAIVCTMAVSRACQLIPMYFFPYARSSGKASSFIEALSKPAVFAALCISAILAGSLLHYAGIIALLVTGITAYIISRAVSNKLGGITGDVIGAVSEISEIVFLVTIIALQGVPL